MPSAASGETNKDVQASQAVTDDYALDPNDRSAKFGQDDGEPWEDLSLVKKIWRVSWVFLRMGLLLGCLYLFICSLGLLEDSFQLLGGKTAGKTFQNDKLLSNPVAGLMIGVLATVLVQSSSTSTSIIITMVGSGIISIKIAVPIIMGANIGTSVTNTLVSLAQASDRNEFRRAFAGATVHDMFNWLTVLVLLPLEVVSGYLQWLTGLIVDTIPKDYSQDKTPDMLKAITKPLTELIVKVDKKVIEKMAQQNSSSEDVGNVLLRWCVKNTVVENVTREQEDTLTIDCRSVLSARSPPDLLPWCQQVASHKMLNLSDVKVDLKWEYTDLDNVTHLFKRCNNLFAQSDLSDTAAGAVLLVCSLFVIFLALYGIVKALHSLLHGSIAKLVRRIINAELPGRAAYFTGYLAILFGTGMTMILQSSSVFTSTLTPLVGVGIVSVERMYPLTLGSNIGTTVTGILAALSQEGEHLINALHVALCHLFFNITGIVLFYPLPFMRLPVDLAKSLGNTTAKHRWFAVIYILLLFVLFPAAVFGLSVAGWVYLGSIGGTFFVIFVAIVAINVIQRKRRACLPPVLRTWDFLPHWLHSLKPIDIVIAKVFNCRCCQRLQEADQGEKSPDETVEIIVEVMSDDQKTSAKANGYVNEGAEFEEHRL